MTREIKTVQVNITGRVQGVFFRAETQKAALSCQINGYVKNMPDGSVQAVFQGPVDQVDLMLAWCRKGAPMSRVDNVNATPVEEQPELKDFQVRY